MTVIQAGLQRCLGHPRRTRVIRALGAIMVRVYAKKTLSG